MGFKFYDPETLYLKPLNALYKKIIMDFAMHHIFLVKLKCIIMFADFLLHMKLFCSHVF